MLLRIIDCPAVGNEDDAVRIVLEQKAQNEVTSTGFNTESYDSPVTDNFRKVLAWYFSEYPQKPSDNGDDSGVVSKLIKCGQSIGEELLGEDHELIKLTEDIEQQGYHTLQVRIESSRLAFFTELWETTILPESKYILSTVVNGYVRRFEQTDLAADAFPPLSFDLKVTPPSQDKVNQLLQAENITPDNQDTDKQDEQPLGILTLVSRARANELPFASSNSINVSLQAMAAGGAIDYDICQNTDWQQLTDRLADHSQPVHIFHYDGPVLLNNDVASIILDDDSVVSIDELAKVLVDNNVAALSIDARAYLSDTEHNVVQNPAQGLAMIAQAAHQQGLGNVIGLGQITDPWTASQCFETIYSQIVAGLSLDQAVVEARKALQSNTETALMTTQPIPFHPWSLLVHYSLQSVNFFGVPSLGEPDAPDDTAQIHEKLFGFRTQMLPPMLSQVSDGQVLQLIEPLQGQQGAGVAVLGEQGSGKSQLAHVACVYLAQKQQLDYGFYFDFAANDYTPDDMLEMIAPVIGLEVKDTAKVVEKLSTLNCCFVLDDMVTVSLSDSLKALLQSLSSHGHKLIITGDVAVHSSELDELVTSVITLAPLHLVEQKIIAAEQLRQLGLAKPEQDQAKDFADLLTTVGGHPWLTSALMPLLNSDSAKDLQVQVAQAIGSNADKVTAFYQWQWSGLDPVWQKLLVLCADVRGLLLEMLMIATDQKQPFAPAQALFSALGAANEDQNRFAEGLNAWASAGFLSRFPHGRMIDSRCLDFLASKRETCLAELEADKTLQLNFSQLICEGIRLLALHVNKQPNPNISNNLLINRRHWVKHFEILWFGGDYRGFMAVKSAFDQLLQQAKIGEESQAWALDLLQRTPLMTQESPMEARFCWLALASGVLSSGGMSKDQADVSNSDVIKQGALYWRDWFNGLTPTLDEKQLPLFQQVVTFLEHYYQSESNWAEAIVICQKSYHVYQQYQAWHRVIQALKSLALYHVQNGDKAQALVYEAQIIDDIPYEDSPPGFKIQQWMDILFARLARLDTDQAQTLLDKIQQSDGADKLADMLDGVQCDIYYQQQNYGAALPYYCQSWGKVLKSEQGAQIEQLQTRLLELKQKLGESVFNPVFELHVDQDTIKPGEYVTPA